MNKKVFSFLIVVGIISVVISHSGSYVSAAPRSNSPGQNKNSGGGGNAMTISLTDYRFRNDDGGEATATWKAPLNTPVMVASGEAFRLRVRVAETAGRGPRKKDNPVKDLHWHEWIVGSIGGWSPQVTQCDAVGYVDSIISGADTTEQLETTGSSYIVDNNGLFDWNASRSGDTYTFDADVDVELEACLVVPAEAQSGDIVQFKVDKTWTGGDVDTIVNMPTVIVQ